MPKNADSDRHFLERTAKEVKNHRVLVKILSIAAALLVLLLSIAYISAVMYSRYGSLTVTVNKFDSVKYALSLSETLDFTSGTMRLNANALKDITNISVNNLPDDLDKRNGLHSGENHLAYKFYLKNAGIETIDCEYQIYIANMTNNIERAARIRLYVNGVYTDYAMTSTDGSGPEENTTEFYNDKIVVKDRLLEIAPNDINEFTVVIWLEGDDPDCVDSVLGGQFKVDMSFSIVGVAT